MATIKSIEEKAKRYDEAIEIAKEINNEQRAQPFNVMARVFPELKESEDEKNRLKHCNSITNEQAELEQGFIDQHINKHQRMPTFLDAIEYGMQLMKEHPDKESFAKRLKLEKEEWEDEYRQQMMEDAIDVEVMVDAGGYPYIPQMELYNYDNDVPLAKEGDKYKVVLIKED